MRVQVRNTCEDFKSYRAARVKSLFNCESGANFALDADLPIDDDKWRLGVVVGPSGSGKTSIGRKLFGGGAIYDPGESWPVDLPIVDAIAPGGDFDGVVAALAAVGLGSVPAWLRPYGALSNGERFRADLARIVAEAPARVVVDEFSSVVDRQIARVGAGAFAKAWGRTGGQAVLLSCHYDVLDWLEPDWVYDTKTGEFARGGLWRRPRIEVEIVRTGWGFWPYFAPHHYLKAGRMPFACVYVAFVGDEPVAHVGVSGVAGRGAPIGARVCRLVVMPEWQGAGIGMKFLDAVCDLQIRGGEGAWRPGTPLRSYFHTSHPGLCAALRRSPKWRQVSAVLSGGNRAKSAASMRRSGNRVGGHYGGHFRAVQGFRFDGAPAAGAAP